MPASHVIVLEREPVIARDMGEEVSALDAHATVHLAKSVDDALSQADPLDGIDLLIISPFPEPPGDGPSRLPDLARRARAIMVLGEEEPDWLRDREDVHVARTPFTSWSLRRDLCEITVAGVPLFPRTPRESGHSPAPPS